MSGDSLSSGTDGLTPPQTERVAGLLATLTEAVLGTVEQVKEAMAMKTEESRRRAEFWSSMRSLVNPGFLLATMSLVSLTIVVVWGSRLLVDRPDDVKVIVDAVYCR